MRHLSMNALFLCVLLASCSNSTNQTPQPVQPHIQTDSVTVKVDAAGLLASVGLPPVGEYKLDDGHGINFRADNQPPLKIEFREGRINFAWTEFSDEPDKFGKLNSENRASMSNALTYSLGKPLSDKIMKSVANGHPASFTSGEYKIQTSPSSLQNLVTVKKEP